MCPFLGHNKKNLVAVGKIKEFFKHVENLGESDDDDYVDFSKEEGEGFFKENGEVFFIQYMNKIEMLSLLGINI